MSFFFFADVAVVGVVVVRRSFRSYSGSLKGLKISDHNYAACMRAFDCARKEIKNCIFWHL